MLMSCLASNSTGPSSPGPSRSPGTQIFRFPDPQIPRSHRSHRSPDPTNHSGADPVHKSNPNFWVSELPVSALALESIWYHCTVAGTTQKVFTAKKRRFYGLKMWLLLSKMGKWPHDTTHYLLMWQLSIGIYEGFYEGYLFAIVCWKKLQPIIFLKKWKKWKNASYRIRTGYHEITRPTLYHWATEFDI